ncbi:MAG: hypothetical protein H6611_09885 [Ignavibacteriales bacterium]|nr:hypothetical protein [Ignavibacteriales bacterium]
MEYRDNKTGELLPRSLWRFKLEDHEIIREEFLDEFNLANIIFNEYSKKFNIDNLGYNLVNAIYERVKWGKINKTYMSEYERYLNNLPIGKSHLMYDVIKGTTYSTIFHYVKLELFNGLYKILTKYSDSTLFDKNKTDNQKINGLIRDIKTFNSTINKNVTDTVRYFESIIFKATIELKDKKRLIKKAEIIEKNKNIESKRSGRNLRKETIEELEDIYILLDNYNNENVKRSLLTAIKEVVKKRYAGKDEEKNKAIEKLRKWMCNHKEIKTYNDFFNFIGVRNKYDIITDKKNSLKEKK